MLCKNDQVSGNPISMLYQITVLPAMPNIRTGKNFLFRNPSYSTENNEYYFS